MKMILVLLSLFNFLSFAQAKEIASADKKYPTFNKADVKKRNLASAGAVPDCAKEASINDTVHLGYLVSYNLEGKSAQDIAKLLDLLNGDRLYPKYIVPIPRGAAKYNELHVDIPVVAHANLQKDFMNSLTKLARLDGIAIGCDIEGKE